MTTIGIDGRCMSCGERVSHSGGCLNCLNRTLTAEPKVLPDPMKTFPAPDYFSLLTRLTELEQRVADLERRLGPDEA